MDTFNQQPSIWEVNPKLKSLLLGLIFACLASGVGLGAFAAWQDYYREKIYYETEGGLPVHKAIRP